MTSAAQQRWLLRAASVALLLGATSAATAALMTSDHFGALPLRVAAEAWLATGNLTSDLFSAASSASAGCVRAPARALRLPEECRVGHLS